MPSNGYPLSFAQQRLWFLDQLSPGLPHYNVPLVFDVEGPVDLDVLRRSLEELVRRHEALRTVFAMVDGVPRQHVLPPAALDLRIEDLSHLTADERATSVPSHIEREIRRPFNLSIGPILRAVAIHLDPRAHVLILTVHHIAFDAWSGAIIFRELAALYDAFSLGQPSPLPAVPMRYVDFAEHQRNWLASEASATQWDYWRHQLRAPRPTLAWATDRTRPAVPSHKGHRGEALLSEATVQALQRLSHTEGVTPFMTFAAAYAAFLSRLTGQHDIIIGTPIANRMRQELEPLVGFFLNSLALRIDTSGNPTFRELLARTRRVAFEAYANQELPFDRIVEALNPERTLGHTPIAEAFLVVDGTHAGSRVIAVGDVIMRRRTVSTGSAKFDVQLGVWRAPEGRRVVVDVSADLFERATALRMVRQFCHLIEQLPSHADERIDRLSIISSHDQSVLVESWNRTAAPFPSDRSLIDLFDAHVQQTPDADAVLWVDRRISYSALDDRARRVASALRTLGVGPDDRVGLCLHRSPDLIAGALATLMIGAAYVPLDPAYPPARLRFIAEDAGCRIVITQQALASFAGELAGTLLVVEEIDETQPIANVPHAAAPSSLAYVIYTSGSTGTPKGVAIEHRHVVNLVTWAAATFAQEERAGMLASTSMSFDLSVFEWFLPLCHGTTVILVDSLFALPQAPTRNRVTFINSVPAVVREFLRHDTFPSAVSVVAMAGEPLSQSLVVQVYEQPSVQKVFDLYGPTETTVYATCALRTVDAPPTIGRPIANTVALVLDEQHEVTPIGVAGELFIGGAGVGRGYLGRDDLTRDRFVTDPVRRLASGRMYRTGDRVRWRSDGTLEFLGRLDRQIKLRGLRIELGEIETALREHAGVADAVVYSPEAAVADRAQLVACVVVDERCDDGSLYAHLEARLPRYMLPSRIDRVAALPRLPNGKVDIRTIQEVGATVRTRSVTTPRTETEQMVLEIWQAVLNLDAIGVDDHFFQIGGHSLLATQLMVRLNTLFGTSLDIATAFIAPTIAQQARLFDHGGAKSRSSATSETAVERRRLLEWAGTCSPYPRTSSVSRLFEEQAIRTPDEVAIVEADRSRTYTQLNVEANRLAHYLRSTLALSGAAAAPAIGIALPRSIDAIVAMLAVLKAGGVYVPLDPRLPPIRLAALVARAHVSAVIGSSHGIDQFDGIPFIDIEAEQRRIAAAPPTNLLDASPAEALAYVLFTSGTTGDAKAIGVPHRAIARLVYGMPDVHIGRGDTVMHIAPLSFDASTFEIWCPLLHGARIAVASDDAATAPALQRFMAAHDVTTLFLTTSLFHAIVEEAPDLFRLVRQLITGGEVLSVAHVRRALEAASRLTFFHAYGPTETTTFASLHRVDPAALDGATSVPIGRPLLNTRIYLLDARRQLVPGGEDGEVWIGGDGVAAGYLGDPALTDERFVEDPFVDVPGGRMYKSGDLARWRDDGTLDFVRRMDDQIKLRGYRIEPAEIEGMLGQHPAVERGMVIAVDRPTGRTLVAFVILTRDVPPPERVALLHSGLRGFLRERLPDYMVPSEWSAIEALPLLPSGKVDRGALAATAAAFVRQPRTSVVPTGSTVESKIAEIWRTLLDVEAVNGNDTFFDLGGHSLLAIQAVSRIQGAFQVDFTLRAFFMNPTLAAVSAAVERLLSAESAAIVPMTRISRDQPLPLSYSQQRIWFLQRWYGDIGLYNVPMVYRLEGALDVDCLRGALQTIVDRHESLRTVFPLVEGAPVQRVRTHLALPFVVVDLSHLDRAAAETFARTEVDDASMKPFDLENGPLIRVIVLRVAPMTSVLLLNVHHIVCDGWSQGVLFRELKSLYRPSSASNIPELPSLPLQYADFAVWQRQYFASGLNDQLAYWRQQLRAPLAELEWPLDRPRPEEMTALGGRVPIEFSLAQSGQLASFAAGEGVTLFMTALAAFQALLARYTGQHDILVGTPVANRTRPEIEGLIGCFINSLVMRGDLSGDPTFRQLVGQARRVAIEAQANQDLPFELMVDALAVRRSAKRAPLFQAMLLVNDGLSLSPALDGLTMTSVPFRFDFAKFDVTLNLQTTSRGIRGGLEYNAGLFTPEYAERLAADFMTLMSAAVAEPDRRLSEIPLGVDLRHRATLPLVTTAATTSTAASVETADLEARLTPLWCRALDVVTMAPDDNFFDHGGTSLIAVRLFADIERDFGVRLPLSSLFRNGTIRAQARLLLAHGVSAKPWSVLVPIQPLGSQRPFFLVHGIGGEVLSFAALVQHLGVDQPVFGLQAEYESTDADDRLEAVAARYVAAIRAQEPSGPYRIGGYSSGGVLAYEMAQQFVAAGEQVSLLAMIDTAAPKVAEEALSPQGLWRLVKNAAYWTLDDEFLTSDWSNRRARVSSKLRALRARRHHRGSRAAALDAGADVRDLLGLWKVPPHARRFLERYVRMMGAYRPQPYRGTVTLLRARTLSLTYLGAEDFGWAQLAARVVVRHIPGAHDTILKEPRVRDLAAALMERLEHALASSDAEPTEASRTYNPAAH